MKNEYSIENGIVKIEINTQKGKVYTTVDESDFELVNSIPLRWYSHHTRKGLYIKGKVNSSDTKDGKMFLHRFLTKAPKGMVVDHIDGNPLNNCRNNLRVVTQTENNRNRVVNNTSKSKVKCVRWHSVGKKWQAYARPNGKFKSLGLYESIEEAEQAVLKYQKR